MLPDGVLNSDKLLLIFFSAVVLVEWDDGEQSRETAESTLGSGPDFWVGKYLFDLGRKNEKAFQLLIKRHYLQTFGVMIEYADRTDRTKEYFREGLIEG
jgi:hypothetical protein